jgi:hypothetical protein
MTGVPGEEGASRTRGAKGAVGRVGRRWGGPCVRGSMMGWGERGGFDLGSHFVSRSTGGVRGTTQGREKSPALRGECRGVGGVLEWLGVPSVVGYHPY